MPAEPLHDTPKCYFFRAGDFLAVRWAQRGMPPKYQVLDAQLRLRYAEVSKLLLPVGFSAGEATKAFPRETRTPPRPAAAPCTTRSPERGRSWSWLLAGVVGVRGATAADVQRPTQDTRHAKPARLHRDRRGARRVA